MTVSVVDQFEIIDVQQQERHWRALQPCLLEFAVGTFEEVPTVAALGQHIGGRQPLQLAFEQLLSVMSSAMPTTITGCPGSA